MIKKHKGNFETCIISGNQFFDVAKMLSDDGISNIHYIRPYFINAGFACELYLKAIQINESMDSTFFGGHNLKALFAKISNEAQNKIKNYYNYLYDAYPHKIEFEIFLEEHSNPFYNFRYTFESTAEGNSRALFLFCRSLQKYIENNND